MSTNEELNPAIEKIKKVLEDYALEDGLTILKLTGEELQEQYDSQIDHVKTKPYKEIKE